MDNFNTSRNSTELKSCRSKWSIELLKTMDISNSNNLESPLEYQSISMNLPKPPVPLSHEERKAHSLAVETNVLVLATGGTLCMKPNSEGAYETVADYIPKVLKSNAAMHDRIYYNNYIIDRERCKNTLVLPTTFQNLALGNQYKTFVRYT